MNLDSMRLIVLLLTSCYKTDARLTMHTSWVQCEREMNLPSPGILLGAQKTGIKQLLKVWWNNSKKLDLTSKDDKKKL